MRVVVAEDVMLTRVGIVRLLTEAGYDVVGEAEDLAGLMRCVTSTRPDVVVVDIRMPPSHTDEGIVAAQRIRAEHDDIGVLVLSQYVEPAYAMRVIEDHPERVGYLLKDRVFDVAILVDAVRRIADGECVIDPTIVARLVGRRRRTDPLAMLTGREREVLGLLAEGLSNVAIALNRPGCAGGFGPWKDGSHGSTEEDEISRRAASAGGQVGRRAARADGQAPRRGVDGCTPVGDQP